MPEDKDIVATRVADERKPTNLSFQAINSQRSQLKHRRKRLKTLKVELEEAEMFTGKDGETQITTESEPHLEESSLQRLICVGINTEMRCENVYRDQTGELNTVHSEVIAEVNGTLGNSQNSHDDSSMVTGKLEEQSPPSKEQRGYSKVDENEKTVNAFEGENDGVFKDTGTDSHTADGDEAHLPQVQEPIFSYDNRRPNVDHLNAYAERIESLPVDAGDAIQDQTKIENQQSQEGAISETGDFGKPTELDPEEASAANVNSERTKRTKHRSQKGMEDKLFLHRNIHSENDATLEESVSESKSRPSKEESEDETQPPEVLRNQTGKKTTIQYANDASSNVQTGSNLSRNPRTMNKLLTPRSSTVDITDALDRVVARFNDSGVELDARQDSGLMSGEPARRSDEERKSLEESDNAKHVELYLSSVSEDFEHWCSITQNSTFDLKENKPEVPHVIASHQNIVIKKELNGFFDDFSAFDSVHAYWNQSYFDLENKPLPYQNNDIIVMAVENSEQQRRGMDRRNLKERIAMATCHLAAIDSETAKEEGRLLELVQEVGDARLESERSKQELHEEQNRYR